MQRIFYSFCLFFFLFVSEGRAETPKYLIGVFSLQKDPVSCPENPKGKIQWSHESHPEIGFVPVALDKMSDFVKEGFQDKIVIAKGNVKQNFADDALGRYSLRVVPDQSCGFWQMRSDWLNGHKGLRLLREVPLQVKRVAEFSVESLDFFPGFQVMPHDSTKVRAALYNPLPVSIQNVRMIAHYESCKGKAMSTQTVSESTDLKPNKIFGYEFPIEFKGTKQNKISREKVKQKYIISSIQVVAEDENVLFDLDWPLQKALKIPSCDSK